MNIIKYTQAGIRIKLDENYGDIYITTSASLSSVSTIALLNPLSAGTVFREPDVYTLR